MSWATFWAIFSQTHLVTLLKGHKVERIFDRIRDNGFILPGLPDFS
jgi:hypothetical protein